MKDSPTLSQPSTDNPFDDCLSQRQIARKLKRSQTTMKAILRELSIPFLILRGRRLYRYSALEEKLRAKEITPDEAMRFRRKPRI